MQDHRLTVEQPPFVMVPIEVLEDHRLDSSALAVYAALRSFCDHGKDTGAFPSGARIASRARCTDRTVRTKVKLLMETGWITVKSGKAEGKSNHYTVHYTIKEGRKILPTPSENLTYRGRKMLPTTKSHSTEIQLPTEVSVVFDFWDGERKRVLKSNRSAKPTNKRIGKVAERLAEGFSVDDLKRAVRGCMSNGFNVDGGHFDLELICRDEAHTTRYMQLAKTNGRVSEDLEIVSIWSRACVACLQPFSREMKPSEAGTEWGGLCDNCNAKGQAQ